MSKMAPESMRFAVIATDVVLFSVFNEALHVFLIDINRPPHYMNIKGLPGGLIGKNETAENAVKRHLKEKGGISKVYIEQLYTFSGLKRDPRNRVVSVGYFGIVSPEAASRAKNIHAAWVRVKKVPKLAFDHNEMIEVALKRLRSKFEYTNIAMYFLPRHFTLTELQKIYEIVLGKDLDKRNFRKRILALNVVTSVGKKQKGAQNRPAELHRFTTKKLILLPILA